MVYGKGKVFETRNPDESTLDANGYVGVDPIYQNAANAVDKPLEGEDVPDEEVEEKVEEPKGDETPTEKVEEKVETTTPPPADVKTEEKPASKSTTKSTAAKSGDAQL